ncbi:DUF871 domain-containing protein [Virgibacillus halophilus]|uniref:DUF871 domain-containing protein n=1 Tax=Tigheibacillus halophilus TaxID=361280 RepID=A0ABU5C1U7_9BACI|nr:DUF871 domain-containing protein [Virgibacillus halophilus]
MQLLRQVHTSRRDYADFVIRSTYSTAYPEPTGVALAPNHTAARPLGTITIDNTNYGRYAGELQITKTDLSSDKRVNVIGRVITEDQPLLPYITPHTRFTFQIS